MDPSPTALVKLLAPKLPYLLKNALFHTFGLSENSSKWDLRTDLTVKVLRSIMDNPHPHSLEKVQRSTLRDPGIKGEIWISKVEIPPPPEEEARQALFKSIDDLKDNTQTYIQPSYVPVGAEWTGYRANAEKDSVLPSISEQEKYKSLVSDTKSSTTILYFHGGAYYLLDPSSHRPVTSRLAQLTGSRLLSVRYRLAPQSAFPSQLLDGLCAYLYLLHPPPGSFHDPIPASQIVFAGDSAGGNLSFALLQLLMHLHRTSPDATPTILYHGAKVEVPLPAGVAGNSPWLDISRSPPSLESNAHIDYLPPPSKSANVRFPKDDIWPTDPPRGDIFCDVSMLTHPLVSPIAFAEKDWKDCPPLFICCGEELLTDENAIVAGRAARQGVSVQWEQFEAMPHCFAMILEGLEASRKCFGLWAEAVKEMVEKPTELETRGRWWTAKTLKESALDVKGLGSEWSEDKVLGWMQVTREKREEGWEGEGKDLPKL